MPTTTIALGRVIQRKRVRLGVKPGEFARRADCSRSHLRNVEAGRVNASVELLSRISTALGVELVDLLGEAVALAPIDTKVSVTPASPAGEASAEATSDGASSVTGTRSCGAA